MQEFFIMPLKFKVRQCPKFIVITKLVAQKNFPTDSQAFEGLRKLVKDRNKLVHCKSKKARETQHAVSNAQKEMYAFLKYSLKNAYETILLIAKEMDSLHDGKTHYHSTFEHFDQCHA